MSVPNKRITLQELRSHFHDGMTLLFGGFMGLGTPDGIFQELLDAGTRDLTIIGDDTGTPGRGVGPLVVNHRVKKAIVGHIGTNPETGRQMLAGEIEIELSPLGTLAERIRCGGAGLGGVLTPTGVGTVVEEGKTKLTFDGVEYLVERALRAELGIVKAHRADASGNLVYQRTARNYNPMVAMAADFVIAEVDEVVPNGELDPECIITPGILVDAIVLAEEFNHVAR